MAAVAVVVDVSFVGEAGLSSGAHDKFPLFGLSREIWGDAHDTELVE